ncbi:SO_0444 family Cu/Zn efflux transporter [Campylobacterota bacterium DY0563]
MEIIQNFFENFLDLLNAMSIYIIIGLFFAGVLKQLIPDTFVSSHLGKDSTSSVIKATLFGIPLPVCSCSVIPLAQGLKKEGASKGAVQSFLISTPITGVDSILATYSLFGFVFTLYRVVSSIIIAIAVGLVQNLFEKKDTKTTHEDMDETQSCCSSNSSSTSSCCSSSSDTTSSCCSSSSSKKGFSFIAVLKYGYGTLFNDMAKALIIGLILGALFVTFTPKEYTQMLFENQFLTYIVVMLFAMPLYTCATASLPIAAAFMIQGMSPGAVFIFLTAGPATSAVTMSVVYKMLGKTALIVYLVVIAIMALLFGYLYDTFFKELSLLTISIDNEEVSIFNIIASIAMIALIVYHIFKDKFNKKETSCCDTNETCSSSKPTPNKLQANKPQNSFVSKGGFSLNQNTSFKTKL